MIVSIEVSNLTSAKSFWVGRAASAPQVTRVWKVRGRRSGEGGDAVSQLKTDTPTFPNFFGGMCVLQGPERGRVVCNHWNFCLFIKQGLGLLNEDVRNVV